MRASEARRGGMSLKEAARYTGVSEDMLKRAIHSVADAGDLPPLPARMVGSRYLVLAHELDAWLESLPEA